MLHENFAKTMPLRVLRNLNQSNEYQDKTCKK